MKRPFANFLAASFINAFLDNAFKTILSLVLLRVAAAHAGAAVATAAAVFTLPFLLFSSWAGSLADRHSKRDVFAAMQAFSVFAFALGGIGLFADDLPLVFASLFLAGLQAAFASPAKYGLLAEMHAPRELSRANGATEAVNFAAIVLGTASGGFALATLGGRAALAALLCAAAAIASVPAALRVERRPAAAPTARVNWIDPLGATVRTLRRVMPDARLGAPIAGLAFFWFCGAIAQMNVMLFARTTLFAGHPANRVESLTGFLLTALALGIGCGSLLAARWSGPKVEIGLVPLGAIGIALFQSDLGLFASSLPRTAADLFALGLSGGLFAVPLQASLQARAPDRERGTIIGASNFLTFTAILAASALLPLLERAGLTPCGVFLLMSAATLGVSAWLAITLGEFVVRFLAWLATHTIYDITIRGRENIPERGPALLVANHVSYIDALLIGACFQRFIRFLMFRDFFERPLLRLFCSFMKAIPISQGDPASSRASLDRAAEELKAGHVVCIFAEGMVTRDGNLLAFRRGFERIARHANAPVIPVHLDGVWGSIFSFDRGRVLFKRPRRIPYPVIVSFGSPMNPDATAHKTRQAVSLLGADALAHRVSRESLVDAFARTARGRWFRRAVSDSSGASLSYGRLFVLAEWIARRISVEGENRIGILLPPTVAGAVANVAVAVAGRTPVNLNFTASREAFRFALERSEIRTVVTSKQFLARTPVTELAGMRLVMMEDLMRDVPRVRLFLREALFSFLPLALLRRAVPSAATCRSEAAIIFSSGSTGLPKGVVLTHANVRANIEGLAQVFEVDSRDVILGTLPFFHSFGFTATIWFPLVAGFAAHYHANPLDPKGVGAATRAARATLFVTTPTFAAAYLKRTAAEDFASLRFTMAGAEAMRAETAERWRGKFGSPILEGYGATECAPVVAVNTPSRSKTGSVGRPLPGICVRAIDRETGIELGPGREGMLEVRGANVMSGYLSEPALTAAVLREGWYATGDVATIDRDGFLRITGRLARFSKIGGEMVPHGAVEEKLLAACGAEAGSIAVAGARDKSGREKLAVLHAIDVNPFELTLRLRREGLPNLWIPAPADFHRVDALPILGSGKLDLRAIRALAGTFADERIEAAQDRLTAAGS